MIQVSALLSLKEGVIWNEDEGRIPAEWHRGRSAEGGLSLSAVSVKNACRAGGLSPFMVPKVVLAQHSLLPTNASGKILKHVVRDIMLARLQSVHAHSRL